jgi:hypothetical protein
MTGLLITVGYSVVVFATWIAGAVRIGERYERIEENAVAKGKESWSAERNQVKSARWYLRLGVVAASTLVLITGLLWPLLIPMFLAFSKGQDLGAKRKQMQQSLAEANAEIERIRKTEGWATNPK